MLEECYLRRPRLAGIGSCHPGGATASSKGRAGSWLGGGHTHESQRTRNWSCDRSNYTRKAGERRREERGRQGENQELFYSSSVALVPRRPAGPVYQAAPHI